MPGKISHPLRARPNITVVPLRLQPPSSQQLPSPRHPSKGKIKVFSPSCKPNRTSALKENNPPKMYPQLGGQSKTNQSKYIQLGGQSVKTNSQNRSIAVMSPNDLNHSQSQAMNNTGFLKMAKLSNSSSEAQMAKTQPSTIVKVFRSTSPSQQIYINNRLVRPSPNKDIPSWMQQVKTTQTSRINTHSHGTSNFQTSKVGSQPIIYQQNTIQNLKDSYEGQMDQLKKLQSQINSNNQEIKQLLKASRASIKKIQPEKEESVREMSIWADNNSPKSKTKIAISKKTIINDLKIQTENRIQKVGNSQEEKIIDEVSVQTDNFLPEENVQVHDFTKFKGDKLRLSKNNQCQVQLMVSVHREVQPSLPESPQKQMEEKCISRSISRQSLRSQVYLDDEKQSQFSHEQIQMVESGQVRITITPQNEDIIQESRLSEKATSEKSEFVPRVEKVYSTTQIEESQNQVQSQSVQQYSKAEAVVEQSKMGNSPNRQEYSHQPTNPAESMTSRTNVNPSGPITERVVQSVRKVQQQKISNRMYI